MSQDILADALNGIRNAKKARKENVKIKARVNTPAKTEIITKASLFITN